MRRTSRVSPSTTVAGLASTATLQPSLSSMAISTSSAPVTQPAPPLATSIESVNPSSPSTATSSAIAAVPVFVAT